MEAVRTIIRAPKGVDRREIPLSEVQVPDLWHIAAQFRDAAEAAGHIFDVEDAHHVHSPDAQREKATVKVEISMAGCLQSYRRIMECWHLCHDLLLNLKGDTAPR